ncbi:HERC1, partial [Symbiodinium sp. KB8]
VQEEAQFQLGVGLRCLISAEGEVLPRFGSLYSLGITDGATLTAHTRGASLSATGSAFALLRSDGRVVTWGDPDRGGDSSIVREKLFAVHSLTATAFGAFAAVKTDGSVVTWGNPAYGGISDSVRARLTGVQQITASAGAFAALRADSSVVTWGHKCDIWSTACRCLAMHCAAFAALRRDGTVVTWGCAAYGGDSHAVQAQLRSVQQIEATVGAFAAQREDGSVITWGHRAFGGDSGSVQHLLKDVRQVRATLGAFAGLCADGSVVSWGLEMISGNDLPLDVLQNVKDRDELWEGGWGSYGLP